MFFEGIHFIRNKLTKYRNTRKYVLLQLKVYGPKSDLNDGM